MATMQPAPDLGIPDVKPAIESIRGRWEPKMSPRRRHALLQSRLCAVLTAWAENRGEVGSEWRFYFLPPGERPSSLVPDVAYVSFERMPPELGELREQPTIAPDIAVEVLSPGDRPSTLREKIALYFGGGSRAVLVVDPMAKTLEPYSSAEAKRTFCIDDVPVIEAYPDLRIDLRELFRNLD